MDETAGPCHCPCFCSAAGARLMEDSIARYSDRSSFANNTAQDTVNYMSAMFQANAVNVLNASTQPDPIATQLAALYAINRSAPQ